MLDLGCGPGVDSLFLAGRGARVTAVDRSSGMLAETARRCADHPVTTARVDLDDPEGTLPAGPFAGVLSDFGVLNCVPVAPVADALARRLRPGGWLVVVPMTRPAIAHHASLVLAGHPVEAVRRAGSRQIDVSGEGVAVHFPTARAVRRTFTAAGFTLVSQQALGAVLPAPGPATRPLHRWVPRLLPLERRLAARWPFRSLGDHTLFVFRMG